MEREVGRSGHPPRDRVAISHVLAAALVLTLLNTVKPLTIDDPSYYLHAHQVARDPFDPYGGEMFHQCILGPAVHNVAPPVLPYWLALGVRVVGDHPGLLKLWLLPFALILAAAAHALLRRFARGLEGPGTWMIVLSPAVVPSLNLMLDIPALALSLAAIVLFLDAADRRSTWLALGAGAVLGLAMQTKYTGFTAAAVFLGFGALRGRLRMAVMACALAAAMFVSWELWIQHRYGESQLMYFIGRRARGETGTASALSLIKPLIYTAGALAAPLIPLGLLGLGAPRRLVVATIALVTAAYLAFVFLPTVATSVIGRFLGARGADPYNSTLLTLAPLLAAVCAGVLGRLDIRAPARGDCSASRRGFRWRPQAGARLLTLWLTIEVVAYLTISTFAATRRMLGVIVVLTLITCRLASRAVRRVEWRRGLVWAVAILSVVLGLFYFAVDLDDAWAERTAVRLVQEEVAARGGGRIWFLATHWGGFHFYAPRAGLQPVFPGRSSLEQGDWLVIPWNVTIANRLTLADSSSSRVAVLPWPGRLPISTHISFYRGSRPIRRVQRTWVAAVLYRVSESGRLVGVQVPPRRP